MKLQTYILSLILLLGLVSCSSDETVNTLTTTTSSDMPVQFGVYTGSTANNTLKSRGASISVDSIKNGGIGVFAFYQKAKSNGYPVNFNKYTGEPTFMYNQQVTATTDAAGVTTWDYTPHKYWSNNENDQFSFFAYAPYDETYDWTFDYALETNLKGTIFKKQYIIEDDVADQQDFLWANPILNMQKPTNTSETLQFSFRHLCARLTASAKVNVKATSIYVTVDTVKITGAFYTGGTLVYTPEDGKTVWEDVTGGTTARDYYPFKAKNVADPETGTTTYQTFVVDTLENKIGDPMFMMQGTQDIKLTAIVSQRSSTTSWHKSYEITKTFSNMALKENKAYNFLLNITLTPVTFTGSVDATWSSSTTTYTSPDNGNSWTSP